MEGKGKKRQRLTEAGDFAGENFRTQRHRKDDSFALQRLKSEQTSSVLPITGRNELEDSLGMERRILVNPVPQLWKCPVFHSGNTFKMRERSTYLLEILESFIPVMIRQK